MTIMKRGRAFLQRLRDLVRRTPWEERQCPTCQGHDTWKHGSYRRRIWTLTGRQTMAMQRYWCCRCRRTFTPDRAEVGRRCRSGRDVRRSAIDRWQHGGRSVRRTAAWVRSLVGRQERWCLWRPWAAAEPYPTGCRLGASTVHRWLGADGLWAKLRGKTTAVVLLLSDRVTGLVYPPVVATEDDPAAWGRLVLGAARAGLRVSRVRGLVSDGSRGLAQFLEQRLVWVHHQRCVLHL